jgi:hypothetical protein
MLRMRNKQNGSIGAHGNKTVNLHVLILRTRLQSLHANTWISRVEYIFCPYRL